MVLLLETFILYHPLTSDLDDHVTYADIALLPRWERSILKLMESPVSEYFLQQVTSIRFF